MIRACVTVTFATSPRPPTTTRQLTQITNMFRDNQQPPFQPPAEDDAAMQVDRDESVVPHHTSHTLPSSQSIVSIPDDDLEEPCILLRTVINPSRSDEDIGKSMPVIHSLVYGVLQEDPALSTRRAKKDEFLQNVQRIGGQRVINDFEEAAKKENWRSLISNGTSRFPLTSIVLIMVCRQRYSSSLKLYDHRRGFLRRWSRVSHGPEDRG